MKKSSMFRILAVLFLLLAFTFMPGQLQAAKAKIKPGGINSFNQVSAHLNEGGDFYMYMSTEKFIKFIEGSLDLVKEIMIAETKEPEKHKEIETTFKVIGNVLKDSGLYEISGVGMSSVKLPNGLNHEKSVLHHYPNQGNGLIWQMSEALPHDFDSQKLLPANTAFASFSDNRLDYFWQWLQKEAAASGIPKLQQAIAAVKPLLMSKGIDLDATIKALGKQSGIIFTLDESKMCPIPLDKEVKIEIPDPALAIVFYVPDEAIFQMLQKFVPLPVVEEMGMKKMTGPVIPLPVTVNPMFVQKGNLLILASNGKIVDDILAANGALLKTSEFKNLSVSMPAKGNSYTFLSGKVCKIIWDIQRKALEKAKPEEKEIFSSMERLNFFKELTFYSVKENSPEGYITTSNNNLPFGGSAFLPAVMTTGIVAAIAIPNMLTAMQKGKQKSTMGKMKSISIAIEAYIADKNYAPKGDSLEAIRAELEPFYIQQLPLLDGWEHPFTYRQGMGGDKKAYCIGSAGKDGVFSGWEQDGCYSVKEVPYFNNDIILCNGQFVYCPQ